jgi:hypothetical protein
MEASAIPAASANPGPLGQPRGIGFGILMYIITFHLYSLYWVFKTEEEMKQHTREGWAGCSGSSSGFSSAP